MPELPEVETMRRGLFPIVGSRVVEVARPRCRLRPIQIEPGLAAIRRRVAQRVVTEIGRVGKRVLVGLETGDALVFEPRMTGLVLLSDPPDEGHVRLQVTLQGAAPARLLFWDRRGLGSVRLMRAVELAERLGETRLGPDALSITATELKARLGASRRAIKVALLDQKAVAGIGNLYAAEILFRAGLDPRTACSSLRANHWTTLVDCTHHILHDAIRHEGSTLSDGTYRNALNQAGDYQNQHRVYDREGEDCPGCGRPIVRIVQAQRATFFCVSCQRGGQMASGGRKSRVR